MECNEQIKSFKYHKNKVGLGSWLGKLDGLQWRRSTATHKPMRSAMEGQYLDEQLSSNRIDRQGLANRDPFVRRKRFD